MNEAMTGEDRRESVECAHDLCQCTVMSSIVGETYCSDACRQAADDSIESETCPCGHPQCDAP